MVESITTMEREALMGVVSRTLYSEETYEGTNGSWQIKMFVYDNGWLYLHFRWQPKWYGMNNAFEFGWCPWTEKIDVWAEMFAARLIEDEGDPNAWDLVDAALRQMVIAQGSGELLTEQAPAGPTE